MTGKNNSFLAITSILVGLMGLFMIIGGVFSFIGGGLASFFMSSWGLKTAFGGIISIAMGIIAGIASIKSVRSLLAYVRDGVPFLLGIVLSILLLITLIIGIASNNANIFDFTNLIVTGLFTYGAYREQKC